MYVYSFLFLSQLLHSLDEILLLNIDVSFAATSFALSDLAQHQAVQTKLRAEIDDVLQGGDPSKFEDLDKKLTYMEMVLKESARMHPALALSLPEKTVKSVTELGGYQILKGVRKDGLMESSEMFKIFYHCIAALACIHYLLSKGTIKVLLLTLKSPHIMSLVLVIHNG